MNFDALEICEGDCGKPTCAICGAERELCFEHEWITKTVRGRKLRVCYFCEEESET